MHNPHATEGERRLGLWRRAIFLFEKSAKEEGPFHAAGYIGYYIEGKGEDGKTPDLFGFSAERFCVCDVSMSPYKGEQMAKYEGTTPSATAEEIYPAKKTRVRAGAPFLITDALEIKKLPGYNLVQVYPPGGAALDRVDDEDLREKLDAWGGFLTPPPSFNLIAVPESQPDELKKPLVSTLKWAAAQGREVGVDEIVDLFLGELRPATSKRGRAELSKKIEGHVYDLARGALKGFLSFDRMSKMFKVELDATNSQSRLSFSKKLSEWVGITPIERFVQADAAEELENED